MLEDESQTFAGGSHRFAFGISPQSGLKGVPTILVRAVEPRLEPEIESGGWPRHFRSWVIVAFFGLLAES